MRKLFLPIVSFVAAAAAPAADLTSASAAAEAQLKTAVQELATLRESIAAEKVPVAAELRELEQSLLEKRRERDRLQRLRDNSGVELGSLETQVKARTDELTYVGNLLNDYANRLNAALHPAEVELYADTLLPVLNLGEKTELSQRERLTQQAATIGVGLERLSENSGGRAFAGSAVLPDGRLVSGDFVLLGPIGLFAATDGSSAGIAERGGSSKPRVLVFDAGAAPALRQLATQGAAEIPLDATLGRATAIATTKESLVEHIQKGGIWMIPILGFAGLSLVVAAFKLLEISRVKLPGREVVAELLTLLRDGQPAEAERVAKSKGAACASMLLEGVRHARLPKELLDEVMFESLLEMKPKLERGLSLISVTAAVAPLLGLLGTVTGMINTFKAITLFGTGDAKSLSSGISEALITTEWGLIVAIPALLFSAFLSRRANSLMSSMEKTSMEFVNGAAVIKENREMPVVVVS